MNPRSQRLRMAEVGTTDPGKHATGDAAATLAAAAGPASTAGSGPSGDAAAGPPGRAPASPAWVEAPSDPHRAALRSLATLIAGGAIIIGACALLAWWAGNAFMADAQRAAAERQRAVAALAIPAAQQHLAAVLDEAGAAVLRLLDRAASGSATAAALDDPALAPVIGVAPIAPPPAPRPALSADPLLREARRLAWADPPGALAAFQRAARDGGDAAARHEAHASIVAWLLEHGDAAAAQRHFADWLALGDPQPAERAAVLALHLGGAALASAWWPVVAGMWPCPAELRQAIQRAAAAAGLPGAGSAVRLADGARWRMDVPADPGTAAMPTVIDGRVLLRHGSALAWIDGDRLAAAIALRLAGASGTEGAADGIVPIAIAAPRGGHADDAPASAGAGRSRPRSAHRPRRRGARGDHRLRGDRLGELAQPAPGPPAQRLRRGRQP